MKRYTGYLLAGVVLITALISHCSAGVACPFNTAITGAAVTPFSLINPPAITVSPFEGQMGSGDVSPFPDTGGVADPPCPFPRIPFLTGEMSGTDTIGETGFYPPPTDPDGDGFYEDLNGNGSVDYADLVLYINTINWIQENEPLSCFDYDTSGNIDQGDLMFLFEKI